MLLCVSVIVSAAVIRGFLGPFLNEHSGFSPFVSPSRWYIPAIVWSAASRLREAATRVVETKLRGLWCYHPIVGPVPEPDNALWDSWAKKVRECASRVGGYSMLGFKADDLDELTAHAQSEEAREVIQTLSISVGMNIIPTGDWIPRSLAFKDGYDCRVKHQGPGSDSRPLSLV